MLRRGVLSRGDSWMGNNAIGRFQCLARSQVIIAILALQTLNPAALHAGVTPPTAGGDQCAEPSTAACVTETESLLIDVPSPDWRDQIIYFAMIDRFADGDSRNNDQGAGEYAPNQESHYNGGDLAGLRQRLDYIQGIGATTLWVTPPVASQWWDPIINYGGYHGYWARDFSKVDEHFGTMQDYRRLSSDLHRRGMYLMQDIVVNHVGNYFGYGTRGEHYDPNDPAKGAWINTQSKPGVRPTQAPFDHNDPRRADDRALAIYHWTPDISDASDRNQQLTYQTSSLDDINTQNPVVREAFRRIYGKWIDEAGVDAFRIDTAKYTEADFYEAVLHGKGGVDEIAKGTGRNDFLTIGEIYVTSGAMIDDGEQSMLGYLDSADTRRIGAPLGFPLYKEIERVMARGAPTSHLSYRLQAQLARYPNPYLAANFVDNHDVERFLLHGDVRSFRQAYALIMTIPGIPVIYQGDEQGFSERRRAMFKGGFANDADQFDTGSPLYRHIQALATMRRTHRLFTRGTLTIEADTAGGPGIFAYSRSLGGERAYVIFNTADQPALLNRLPLALDRSRPVTILFQDGFDAPFGLAGDSQLTRVLPPKSVLVIAGAAHNASMTVPSNVPKAAASPQIEISAIEDRYLDRISATIAGTSSVAHARLLRIIDGNLGDAKPFVADGDGRWSVDLPVRILGDRQHVVEIFAPVLGVASAPKPYRVSYGRADYAAQQSDPAGDDHGPTGRYRQPLNPTFGCQMDIRAASAKASGPTLELKLTLCDLSAKWSPLNGFDHVSFNIFLSAPGFAGTGATALPGLHAAMPDGGHWNIAHELHGWGNIVYSAQGSGATTIGKLLSYAPEITLDGASKTITLTYDGGKFGVTDWKGASIYATTWDRDGGDGSYRGLSAVADEWRFGGGRDADPLIADDVSLRLVPVP